MTSTTSRRLRVKSNNEVPQSPAAVDTYQQSSQSLAHRYAANHKERSSVEMQCCVVSVDTLPVQGMSFIRNEVKVTRTIGVTMAGNKLIRTTSSGMPFSNWSALLTPISSRTFATTAASDVQLSRFQGSCFKAANHPVAIRRGSLQQTLKARSALRHGRRFVIVRPGRKLSSQCDSQSEYHYASPCPSYKRG